MSMPKAKLTKIILAELAAVPVGAQDAQGTAILKRKEGKQPTEVRKQSAMTTAVQGHQHLLYAVDESQSGTTSYESSYAVGLPSDAYTGHCHPWIRNADGSIAIGESLGHSHDIGELSASLAAAGTVEKNATATGKSTRSPALHDAGTQTKESTMPNEHETKIADLEKQVARLSKIAKLSGAHKAHFDTLAADEQDASLAKSASERDTVTTEVAKRHEEAEKVVYVSKSTGDVYKAKDDPRLVDMAKRMDEQAAAIEKSAIRKQALDVLGGTPGSDDAHDLIIRSLTKSGAKQEEIDAALAALKGMRESSTIGKRAPGFGGTEPQVAASEAEALEKYETGLKKFAVEKNIKNVWTDARAAFDQTDEGKALKRAYDDALNG